VVDAGNGLTGRERTPLGDLLASPNAARIYDYWLGGKDNLAVDREIAVQVAEIQPLVVTGVRANRAFVRRAVAFLAERGIDQFRGRAHRLVRLATTGRRLAALSSVDAQDQGASLLRLAMHPPGPPLADRTRLCARPLVELGSGLPAAVNVHEIAGRVLPQARTVYVDRDPMVLVHARALLADSGRAVVVEGDVRDPAGILGDPHVRRHLDHARPVAVVMAAILHFITPQEDPARIVRTFREAMAPGSALAVTHVVDDGQTETDAATRQAAQVYSQSTVAFIPRSREDVARLFEGFTLVPPGLVEADTWRRRGDGRTTAPIVAGVGLLEGPGTGTAAGGGPGSGHSEARYRRGGGCGGGPGDLRGQTGERSCFRPCTRVVGARPLGDVRAVDGDNRDNPGLSTRCCPGRRRQGRP
jgi:hypothetical protein